MSEASSKPKRELTEEQKEKLRKNREKGLETRRLNNE
jgi:hypothetical protein